MARKRPTSLLVLGILHLTFGTLGILDQAGNAAVAWWLGSTPALFGDLFREAERVPYAREVTLGSTAFDLLLSLLLIAGGIGLVRMRPWARSVSLTYATLSILFHTLEIVYSVVFALPYVGAYLGRTVDAGLASALTVLLWVLSLGYVLLYFIFPVFVVVWLSRRRIADALRNGGIEEIVPAPM